MATKKTNNNLKAEKVAGSSFASGFLGAFFSRARASFVLFFCLYEGRWLCVSLASGFCLMCSLGLGYVRLGSDSLRLSRGGAKIQAPSFLFLFGPYIRAQGHLLGFTVSSLPGSSQVVSRCFSHGHRVDWREAGLYAHYQHCLHAGNPRRLGE